MSCVLYVVFFALFPDLYKGTLSIWYCPTYPLSSADFSPCCSHCVVSIDRSSSSPTPSCVVLVWLMSPFSQCLFFKFQLLYFLVLKVLSFLILSISFVPFILRSVQDFLVERTSVIVLNSLSNNFIFRVSSSHRCLFLCALNASG